MASTTTGWMRSAAKFLGLCVAALAALFPAACTTPSLNPAYTATTLERPARIEGTWTQVPDAPGADGKAREPEFALEVTQGKDGLYNVDLKFLKPQNNDPAVQRLVVGFTRIDGTLFADAAADFDREPTLKAYGDYLVPAHVFCVVMLDGDTLTVTPMKGGGVNEAIEKNPETIAHTKVPDSNIVLTAETSRLREFLATRAEDESFFSGGVKFARDAAK